MTLPFSYQIKTEYFILRSTNFSDLKPIHSVLTNEEHLLEMSMPVHQNVIETEKLINHYMKVWHEEKYNFSIIDTKDSKFLGHIAIRKTNSKDTWNIGYWIHPLHQGKGIMSEACSAILELGFNVLNANKITAFHTISNKASESVLKKNGFVFQKYYKTRSKKNGNWREENLLSIYKKDWEKTLNHE